MKNSIKKKHRYVLITPARNEEKNIKKTIESVISQTVLPLKWVIVSDGSTDATDKIAKKYAKENNFITFIRIEKQKDSGFSSKVYAFNAGFNKIKSTEYDFIGNLDADVSFSPDYFNNILKKFDKDKHLGICGGVILEFYKNNYRTRKVSLNSVAGAVQLFRRQCYEDVGGYIPLKLGGIDTAAEIIARSRGWKVKSFPEFLVYHNERILTGSKNVLLTKFKQGKSNFELGYHPIFQLIICIYRLIDKPYLFGSIFMLFGYIWASIQRVKKQLPDYSIKYLRKEQMNRLKALLSFNKEF